MIRRATLLAAVFGASAVMAPLMAQAAGPVAEVVYRNGRIYTLDPKSSVISAVAVMDGKFLAVGGEADVKPFIGPQTQVIDLGGKPVIPGLNAILCRPGKPPSGSSSMTSSRWPRLCSASRTPRPRRSRVNGSSATPGILPLSSKSSAT